MPEKQTIPANADVLAWARDESGYTLGDAAQRLGISTAELAAIERGELAPSIETFHRMSRVYKQIESVLLLPSPPETDPLPRLPIRSCVRSPPPRDSHRYPRGSADSALRL